MGRRSALLLLLGIAGCGPQLLRLRLECEGRTAEGPLGPLRLDLEEGRAILVTSCASEGERVRVACRILQDGWILDEADLVVDVNGDAEFSIDLEPRRPIRAEHRAGCPMTAGFTPFEPPIDARVRLSIR